MNFSVFWPIFVVLLSISQISAEVMAISSDPNFYQLLAPRFRRAEIWRRFDGGETAQLQNLLENLRPRF
ncbi:unnamed protein product [Caenorhabditis angaria]|uniref:Uncharacterized protein n=1 Tax=Caenorhabditis angaria TaxID=860376 RepID=A0A9P1IKW7_9PELO|nr:unnamed protein product [Caenorhabditis angaria]CAI5446941.1 unnamed protein product [Caenorhabditis angaria]